MKIITIATDSEQKLDLNEEDEERYFITPKGILLTCLMDLDITIDYAEFDRLWDKFELEMYRHGYIYDK